MKKQVTERALATRVDRALRKQQKTLRKTREDSPFYADNGMWYVVDLDRNAIEAQHVNLVGYARELGVLADWEEVAG
jgi:hypothetical protein